MASGNLFEFLYSPQVSPVPCSKCGANMHCVRRSPQENGERRIFMCATCGESTERIAGGQVKSGEAHEEPKPALPAFLVREMADRRNEP